MTRRTEAVAQQVIAAHRLPVVLSASAPTDLSAVQPAALTAADPAARTLDTLLTRPSAPPDYTNLNAAVYRTPFFEVAVDYGGSPLVHAGQAKTIKLRIRNLYKVQDYVNIHWYALPGWQVSPAPDGKVFVPCGWLELGATAEAAFQLTGAEITPPLVRFAVELTITGRPTVLLAPVVLVNDNLGSSPR
jgi:hypothetical protein